MMLSYIDDVEQLTGLVAGRLFSEGGDGTCPSRRLQKRQGFTGDGFQRF